MTAMGNQAQSTRDLILDMPKAELHIHVEATLEAEMLLRLAERNGIDLGYGDEAAVRAAYEFDDLVDFLNTYYLHLGVLTTEQDFSDLTHAYAARATGQGVKHFELFFDPQAHTRRGIPFRVAADGIADGLRRAEREFGVSTGLIMCILRDEPVSSAQETLDAALASGADLLGVGLDSAEVGYPPSLFTDVYAQAGSEGLRLVAHAGEEGPPAYVWEALRLLKIERVDHGVRSIEDPALVEHLRDTQIPVTTCPLSNVRLRVVDALEDHQAVELLRLGCCATINADGPAYFGGYVGDNYFAIAETFDDLTWGEMVQFAANSIEASFASAGEKGRMRSDLDSWITGNGVDLQTPLWSPRESVGT